MIDNDKKIDMTRKIVIVFVAAATSMFFMNELQRHVTLSESEFHFLGFLIDVISAAIVLKIQPWRPNVDSPSRHLISLFFMFGAFSIALLSSHYWMQWASSFDPEGQIFGQVRPVEPISVSSQNPIDVAVL